MRRSPLALPVAFLLVGAGGLGYYGDDLLHAAPSPKALNKGSCNIKGNISKKGERIYHVPGQAYYFATSIDGRRGERWFCSEAEARSAGWWRSRI